MLFYDGSEWAFALSSPPPPPPAFHLLWPSSFREELKNVKTLQTDYGQQAIRKSLL